jgi:mRNA-degrading endonuclease RelE of RelBE toxin-antitoxin system
MLQNVFIVAISADFFWSFAALPKPQQAKVSRFVEKFRENPGGSGINYEKIEQVRDKNLRSVRIDDTYRGIVLRPEKGKVYVLLWVDHHDEAYRWAANKLCTVNPASGSLQILDVTAARAAPAIGDRTGLFGRIADQDLLRLGVPELYLSRVFALTTEAELDALTSELPEEASEALYMLAAGYSLREVITERGKSTPAADFAASLDFEHIGSEKEMPMPVLHEAMLDFEHFRSEQEKSTPELLDVSDFAAALASPDSQRRFYVVEDQPGLAAMLKAPLADRIREFVHRKHVSPARNAGRFEIEIRAGDIHRNMGLRNRMPAVCAALGPKFEKQYRVRLLCRRGPRAGANVFLRFQINLDDAHG